MGIQSLPPNAGVSRIKKRIRDTERLLKKPGLAATKQVEAERALAAFKAELDGAAHRKAEAKRSKKYHMVKFVERKKALRALRKPDAGDAELAHFYYITRYPRDKKYRALYATENATPESHWFLREVNDKMPSGEWETGPEAIKKVVDAGRHDEKPQEE